MELKIEQRTKNRLVGIMANSLSYGQLAEVVECGPSSSWRPGDVVVRVCWGVHNFRDNTNCHTSDTAKTFRQLESGEGISLTVK